MAGGVRLERAQRKVQQKVMVDRCVVTFDADAEGDDELNPDTLRLEKPQGDSEPVWEGPCKVSPVAQTAAHRGRAVPAPGPVPPDGVTYEAKIPHDAAVIPIGSILEVTSAKYDPSLVGARFVVDSLDKSSLLVSRRLWLREA